MEALLTKHLSGYFKAQLNKEPIGRPRQIYVGETQRTFVPLNKR